MNNEFHLQVAYDGERFFEVHHKDPMHPDRLIERVAGKKAAYSGMGASWAGGQSLKCGAMRDLGFVFQSADAAMAAHRAMRDTELPFRVVARVQDHNDRATAH